MAQQLTISEKCTSKIATTGDIHKYIIKILHFKTKLTEKFFLIFLIFFFLTISASARLHKAGDAKAGQSKTRPCAVLRGF